MRQYHQLERDVTSKSKAPVSSMVDVPSIKKALAKNERNPEATTTMSQHLLNSAGNSKQNITMLEYEADQLRIELHAAITRADRLAGVLAQADQEIHRLNVNLFDLDTEHSTLKRTVHSLEKELQLAQARLIDTQRRASTNRPPHDSHIHLEGHAVGHADVHTRYAHDHRRIERLEEELKVLMDDNQDLQKMVEGFKDAEVDLKKELKFYRTGNEQLRERLAAAKRSSRSESSLNRELESKKDRIAQVTRGKEDAERDLEQLKKTVNIGPELINAFSELERIAGQGGSLVSGKRVPKSASPTGSSGQFTRRSEESPIPIPKRPRYV
jgi:predicted RNase H-like nuclease (RuvC/YqgF family)